MAGFRETLLCSFKTIQRRERLKEARTLRPPLVAVDQLGDSDSARPTVTAIPDSARTVAEFFNLYCQMFIGLLSGHV